MVYKRSQQIQRRGSKGGASLERSKESMGFPRQKILQEDLQRDFPAGFHPLPGASHWAGQEEEEEPDGQAKSQELGRVSFQTERYIREDEAGLRGLEGRKWPAGQGSAGGRGSGGGE